MSENIQGKKLNKQKKIAPLLFWVNSAVLTAVLTAVDRISKQAAVSSLKGKESLTVIDNVFSLTYVENRGAAWGIMSGKLNILVIITMIIIPVIILFMYKLQKNRVFIGSRKYRIVFFMFDMILLLSGALGNLIDRVAYGYVVDFLQVTFISFPVFNVADCYITVGAVLFIIIYLFMFKEEEITVLWKGKIK